MAAPLDATEEAREFAGIVVLIGLECEDKLPFRFDSDRKVFVRLKDESKGGIDQPVKLDVNFNVPVNELLEYKEIIPLFRKLQ